MIFGGRWGEHSISIRSSRYVVESLDLERFELVLLGIDAAGRWHLCSEAEYRAIDREVTDQQGLVVVPVPNEGRCAFIDALNPARELPELDVVFPILHGPYGEDGAMQGLLEMLDVPYVRIVRAGG